jgi:hypothetical protein
MEELIARKGYEYRKIDRSGIELARSADSRALLEIMGIEGEAFIGDLPLIYDYDEKVRSDWDRLKALGVREVFPAHAPGAGIDAVMP